MSPRSRSVRLLTRQRSPLRDALAGDASLDDILRARGHTVFVAAAPYPRHAKGLAPEAFLPEVDDETLGPLRAGRAHLLIDHAAEGIPHWPSYSELLHAWCRLHGVAPSALVYVGANLVMARDYHAWGDEQGVEERYRHLIFNGFVYETALANATRQGPPTDAELLAPGAREHRFLGLNNAARPERLIMVAHLRGGRQADALVSLGSSKGIVNPNASREDAERRFRRGPLLERHPRLFDDLSHSHLASLTNLESPSIADSPMWLQLDPMLYTRTALSVVTETGMSSGSNRRITEKSLKPFLFGHLAVIAGDPGALDIVRGMGFQTFDPVVDESYDAIVDANERYCAVLCEIDRLRTLSDREFTARFDGMLEVRAANLRHARDVLPARLQTDVVRDMMALIADASPAPVDERTGVRT